MENFTLETLYIPFDYDLSERRVRIYLPSNYETSNKRYPVLYMLDGQNVFYDEESYSTMSWRAYEGLVEAKLEDKLIIVAIDNSSENRFFDYVPYQNDVPLEIDGVSYFNGCGHIFADFLVNTIKPVIDETYPTLHNRKHTAVCGSSLGGLMSAYLGSEYSETFKYIGVFSLASYFCKSDFLDTIKSTKVKKKTFYYIQSGTHEGFNEELEGSKEVSQNFINSAIDYAQALSMAGVLAKNIDLNIFAFELHREKYWAKHFPDFLNILKREMNLAD